MYRRIIRIAFIFCAMSNEGFALGSNSFLILDSVSVHSVEVPVLKRNADTPILLVEVHVSGASGSQDLDQLKLDFTGTTDLKDMEKVSIFYTENDASFSKVNLFSKSKSIFKSMDFKGNIPLHKGKNNLWVAVTLSGKANIQNEIDVACTAIKVGGEVVEPKIQNPEGKNKIGIALRKHNDDNVDTYRIPGLVTTNKNTLIAVYDIRRNSEVDLQEDVDIGMNRSTDSGKTWEPMKVIMDMGKWEGLPEAQNGIGDPSILVDEQTNTIWVAAIWAHGHPGERNWWASKPGLTPQKTSQLMLVKSEDDGITWSEEINITSQIKDPKWHLMLQGPGKGITMRDGTLVFPAQYKDENEIPHSTIIWSKDHGKTWHVAPGAKDKTTEAQVIERNDGSLMLNMRDDRNRTDTTSTNGRSVYTMDKLGGSWKKHASSRTNTLQESNCMASLIKEDFIVNGQMKSLVLFSNPNTIKGRNHISIKVSFDDGETWDLDKTLLLDAWESRGYSCMTKVDDHTVGILYEGSQADMTFQLVPIKDIVGK